MAKNIQEYIFEGTLTYPFLSGTNKFDKFSTNFIPSKADDRKAIKATGTKCGVKEDDEGNLYYTFTSPEKEPPEVVMADGSAVTALVGNGTKARVKITVEKFMTKDYGEVARTKLVGVIVDDLKEYVKKEEVSTDTKSDTSDKPAGMPF